jgi:competence protein ComEA
MKWQQFAKDYLSFGRRDRIAIIVLVTLIFFVWLFPKLISKSASALSAKDTTWMSSVKYSQKQSDENQAQQNSEQETSEDFFAETSSQKNYNGQKGQLFYFDPNTLSIEGWQKLGLRDKTIKTIQNYLSKGGKFKKADDLRKIYGLFPDEYERLAPYIKIEEQNRETRSSPTTITTAAEIRMPKPYQPKYSVIDINVADTSAFISLPGIGSKLAARIVSFREKLGGFYSVSQISETYGLPDSTYQKILPLLKINEQATKKININSASKDDLKIHPYIKWNLANAIVEYRNQHGNYSTLADLKRIELIDETTYNKISPYLSL